MIDNVIVMRICGICSLPMATASYGLTVGHNGQLVHKECAILGNSNPPEEKNDPPLG